jgi:FAD/FMN-containing dehydrogenase
VKSASIFLIKWARRAVKTFFLFIILTIVITTIIVKTSGDADFQYNSNNNIVNDVTGLNPIQVKRIVVPENLQQISDAIINSTGPISIGGGRYSQGGQTAYPDSLHLDMRKFNKVIEFDQLNKEITVQPGITWRKLQEYIDPYDFSIKIMQTYSNFTVGGSLSVNVHGRYIGEGPLIQSVKSIKLILADATLVSASPQLNSELFYGAIGGYGGLGVIVEATLMLADNTKIERLTHAMPVSAYRDFFFENIRNNKNVVFHNADIYPPDYENALDVSWYITDKPLTHQNRIIPVNEEYEWGPMAAEFVANYDIGKTIRESIIDPVYYAFDRVVWRNWEASYDVRELEPEDRSDTTYVLREYFVPVENFDSFVSSMREIFQRNEANIINVSIRHAHKDPGSLLAWARSESFAFVVYYQQGTDKEAIAGVKKWSLEMIDAVIASGGSYYLPYQIFASKEQFNAAYPRSEDFFELKNRVDPLYRFRNKLWQQHYPAEHTLKKAKSDISNYKRGEEQTFLTIPEWYLVFNPLEYAQFLESGQNPNDFPFMASINEYWSLYDRVTTITHNLYPDNSEYMTMLQVIGISTTIEYIYKSAYENSIGRFTRWSTNYKDTPEDKIIQQAQRAYSTLIYDQAWYEFDFAYWINQIWSTTDFFGNNFIRKLERKLFFTLEFGFKTFYAKLIEFGAKTAYEQTDNLIYMTSRIPEDLVDTLPQSVNIIAEDNGFTLISIPKWGEFSRVVPLLAESGVEFIDISGNSRITLSIIAPQDAPVNFTYANTLFNSNVVSNTEQKRILVVTQVENLRETILQINNLDYKIEHIFDY